MELCIDFGGTEIKLAVIEGADILASDRIAVTGTAADLDAAVTASRALTERTGAPTAVGIAVPGVVDPATGRMLHANDKYEFLNDFDLRAWSDENFGLPAVVENDARAAMIDGAALRGITGHAGILGGHVTTNIHGPACPCGNVGCGEALASSWALKQGTVKDLFETDDHAATRDEFLRVWGATVVTLCHMYDPRVVILSGGILRAGDAVRTPIETYVREHLWPSMTAPRFVVPPEPEYSVARGLSSLARNQNQEKH